MWQLYVLACADGSLYVGTTTDLPRRLTEHRDGQGARYTRGRGPVRVVYHESHPDRASAQRREAELKRWSRAEKLRFLTAHRRHRRRARTTVA